MAPLNAAGRAALEAFFKGKRGQRQLITTSAVALTDYFAQRGTPLEELNVTRPPTPAAIEEWVEEWGKQRCTL